MSAEISSRGPRPLDYVRIRVHRGGQAELLLEILEDEKEGMFEELGALRGKGASENSDEVQKVQQDLRHVINLLRDLNSGIIELTGKDGF
jgi:hypothetical protein